MFVNFNMNMETEVYDIYQYLGNQLIAQQRLEMPVEMAKMQVWQLCQTYAQDPKPIRLYIEKHDVIYDQFEQRHKQLTSTFEYKNNPYVKWEESGND